MRPRRPGSVAAEKALRLCLLSGFWLPLGACTYLALTPSPPDAVFRISDILLHIFAFAYLTFALTLAYPPRRTVLPGVWMLGYGLLIEVLQSFEPARSAEVKDAIVDLLGIGVGLLLARSLGGWIRSLLLQLLQRLLPGPV